jgi:Peptidase M50B-like
VMVRRNGFGLAAVALTGVGIYLVARYAPVGGQIAVAYGIAWFLLVSGIRVVLLHGRDAGDAIALRKLTRLPRGLWAAIWLAGTAAALVLGGQLLV